MHKQGYYTHAHKSSWNPTEECGNLLESVTGDRKFGMSLNILGDSAWNVGNWRKNDVWFTGASAKPENPPISFEISDRPSDRPSVHLHVSTMLSLVDFTWNLILEILIKIFRKIPILLQSRRGEMSGVCRKQYKSWCSRNIFIMNQDRNIGTLRLSAGFCVCFCFTQRIIMEIFLIYFLTLLNIPARKLFYVKNIREAFEPLTYNF
jgi:hypothetical protein